MSIYGVKYRISYHRFSGGQTTIDILEKDHVESVIIDLLATGDPLEISFEGDLSNIYKPTIGSGATIKIAVTPLTMLNLFTDDPQKFIVKIYNGLSEDSSGTINLIWQGFINTDLYTENYSTPLSLKGEITINCNDGMSVLDNISYRMAEEDESAGAVELVYTGFVTIAEVLYNIFLKLNLDFNTIQTASDLLVAAGKSNIFQYLTVNNENYYDEEGKAMSCREVLNSIFGGLGLVVSFKGNTIYIIDPINLHDEGLGKIYTLTDDSVFSDNETQLDLGGFLDISGSANIIDWHETGQVLDIVRQFNQLEIKYDPYNFVENGYNFDEIGHASNVYECQMFTDNNITYRIYTGILMKHLPKETKNDWVLNGGCSFEGIQEVNQLDDAVVAYYIKQLTTGGAANYSYDFPYSNIKQDENSMLELSMSVYVNTKHINNILAPLDTIANKKTETEIKTLYVGDIEIKIGDYWYDETVGEWSASSYHKIKMYVRQLEADIIEAHTGQGTWWRRLFGKPIQYLEEDTSKINDSWITSILYIPLKESAAVAPTLLSGSISIIISKVISLGAAVFPKDDDGNNIGSIAGIKNVLIKDISVQIVDLNKIPVSKDGILTKANISNITDRKKESLNIELTSGIGPYGSSRGAFSSSEVTPIGTNITGLMRSGDTPLTLYKTSDLLAQNLLSQYSKERFKLTGKLNVKDYLLDVNMKLIKDSDHLTDEVFYIVNGTYHDREEWMGVEMIELENVREPIILAEPPEEPPAVDIYYDWYLPSLDELSRMYTNLKTQNIGGFINSTYWASSEYNFQQAKWISFINGSNDRYTKNSPLYVRAARSFNAPALSYSLGDPGPAGGWIFYITDAGGGNYTYYECSPSNLSMSVWSNIDGTSCPGAEGTAIGTGQQNTLDIIAQAGHSYSAAKECADYSVSVISP